MAAYRAVRFRIAKSSDVPALQGVLRLRLDSLPVRARGAGDKVVAALADPTEMGEALLGLTTALDLAGALVDAVGTAEVAYELALERLDARLGIDAARLAARGERKRGDYEASIRWYRLAQDLAAHIDDRLGLALAYDGEGNTHRAKGALHVARGCYTTAWQHAEASGNPGALSAVGHSLMVVEHEAGRLSEAAHYGWRAISIQQDPEQRARLLVDLGTLLLEAGDVALAHRTYRVAAALASDVDIVALARDGSAYASAVLGEWSRYEAERITAREALRAATGPVRAQAGFFRGKVLILQGRTAAAVRMLSATERIARAAGAAEWAVKAGELMDSVLAGDETVAPAVPLAIPREVSGGLAQLEAEVGV